MFYSIEVYIESHQFPIFKYHEYFMIKKIPKDEQWLFSPENKDILKKVKEGLKQKGSVYLGSFKGYLKELS